VRPLKISGHARAVIHDENMTVRWKRAGLDATPFDRGFYL
jgi:hypothetical protein